MVSIGLMRALRPPLRTRAKVRGAQLPIRKTIPDSFLQASKRGSRNTALQNSSCVRSRGIFDGVAWSLHLVFQNR